MHFPGTRSRFPSTYNNNQGSSTKRAKDCKVSRKNQTSTLHKSTSMILCFLKNYSNYIPWLAERVTPVFFLLKTTDIEAEIPITPDNLKEFRETNDALYRCCQLSVRQSLPGKQLVLMTHASFEAAGYAVLIEDAPNQKHISTRKLYAVIAYGSKTYSPSQTKMSIYAREFLAIYLACEEIGHKIWGATKPVNISTDSKSVTRFFELKMIPQLYEKPAILYCTLIAPLHTFQEKGTQ